MVTSNLGISLAKQGHNVMIIDTDLTAPNLSLHMGIPFYDVTFHDVLKKKLPIEAAIYDHHSGVRIVPASLAASAVKGIDYNRFKHVFLALLGKADIILLDSPPGLGPEAEAVMDVSDELIVVTNPELSAVTDALRALKFAEARGTKVLGVVLNRVRGDRHELKRSEVEDMLNGNVLLSIPEDPNVMRSVHLKNPVVLHRPKSIAAMRLKRLASLVAGEIPEEEERDEGWFKKFFGWLQ